MNYQVWKINLKTKEYSKIGATENRLRDAHRGASEADCEVDEVAVVLPARDLADPASEVQQTLSSEVLDLVVVLYGPISFENEV